MKLAVQIAAGIIIASAVIAVGRYVFVYAQLRAATAAIQQMQVDTERRASERSAKARRAKRQQLEAAASQLRAEAAQERAVQEAEIRKAAAWEAFYVPARKCLAPPNWDVQIECGNAHIRAKREFEERWSRGEL